MTAPDRTAGGPGEVPPDPNDLLREAERSRALGATPEGVRAQVEGLNLVSDAILAQVLFALWDCGFYEYSLAHGGFTAEAAAAALGLDGQILRWLLNHLVGRGLLHEADDGTLALTERGRALSNVLVRGTFNLYLGGYGALLARLGPLLKKELALSDPAVARSGWHTGVGSEQVTSTRIVPAVLALLAGQGFRRVLDLGCGAGGFLVQLARLDPSLRGVGVDMAPDAIEQARVNARRYGVDDRLAFVCAEVGAGPLPLEPAVRDEVDAITAMHMLHEFGRSGREGIVRVLREIRQALPGRRLVFTECFPADARGMGRHPPTTFSQLDYLLVHPLSGQGLPLAPKDWEALLRDAGWRLREVRRILWTGLYVAEPE